eukprot:scaffold4482_cov393-Prasinococcus_capsulatus_cf.AAC.15
MYRSSATNRDDSGFLPGSIVCPLRGSNLLLCLRAALARVSIASRARAPPIFCGAPIRADWRGSGSSARRSSSLGRLNSCAAGSSGA